MKKIKCLICGEEFSHDFSGGEKKLLFRHLEKDHGLNSYEYIKKYFYEGVHPLCACGCGNKVVFYKGDFRKYYKDHKNKIKLTDEEKKIRSKISKGLFNIENQMVKKGIEKKDLKDWFEKYKKPEYNKDEIKKISGMDFRTIEKYWIILEITEKEELERYKKLHKYSFCRKGEKNPSHVKIDNNILYDVYEYLKKNKNKITLKKAINIFGLTYSRYILYKRLTECFGKEEIDNILKSGLSSKPEMEFYHILCYYFDRKNIERQFSIENKPYDFLLFNKLIVEYDGEYWHSGEEKEARDKEKDKLAIENEYIIFRVKEKYAKKIETLLKIKEIIDGLRVG